MDEKHFVAMGPNWLDNPFNPKKLYDLEKQVKTLANICRWNGRCDKFYSVLDHSINLYRFAPDDLKIHALVHDFAEAYTGDWPAPIKKMPEMAWFREMESVLEKRVWQHYAGISEIEPGIMRLDSMIARIEAEALGLGGKWTGGISNKFNLSMGNSFDEFVDCLVDAAQYAKIGGEIGKYLREHNLASTLNLSL